MSGYEDERASVNLPLDLRHQELALRMAKRYGRVSLLVLVGIGGSNLGTAAVADAVLGRLHNLSPGRRPRLLLADTVDPHGMHRIEELMRAELVRGRNVLVNIVCKSGTTTETIADAEVLLRTLMKRKGWRQHIVVTTEEDSPLWHLAASERFATLAIPKRVGGRYSVLSPVGLFPLSVLGIDTRQLLDGAAHMRAACMRAHDNPAVARAAMLYHSWKEGRHIADNFYFAPDLESLGKWYRQLLGESVGKEQDRSGRTVHVGITPAVSIGTTDLHSMAQLYFGGPDDKFYTVVTNERWQRDLVLPDLRQYDALVHNIQERRLSTLMHAISTSVLRTFERQGRPHCHIQLPDLSEASIGALLQLHMFEIIYLAALLDVNPFDQPAVEAYKVETKRILARRRE